ncbi:MAG: glycosyltransferase [Phycisphaerae bacterium]
MIEDRNIICIASNWFYDPTSKHHIMKRLAERNHIVWVNYHASRRPQVSTADFRAAAGKLRQIIEGPRRVSENITVVTPLVLPLPGSAAATNLNRRLLVRQIRSVLRGLPSRPVQLWSFAPDVDALCGRFDEERMIYYCVDAFDEFSGYDSEAIRAAEARLAARADLVVTTSQVLFEAKRSLNENTILVPHGVDYTHFARATAPDTHMPDDMVNLPRPIFGFWGLIQDWIDLDWIAKISAARPDGSVVLIGEAATDLSALTDLPNVHLLGRRPYATLPAYARSFDVGLIPFRVNALTRAVNPIKLREYLAAGLPVISTPLPEVRRYRAFVQIVEEGDSPEAACQKAVEDGTPTAIAARQAAMKTESWSAKVEELSERITECPSNKQRSR